MAAAFNRQGLAISTDAQDETKLIKNNKLAALAEATLAKETPTPPFSALPLTPSPSPQLPLPRVLEQLTAGDSSNAVQELTELFSRAAIAPGPQQPAAGVAAQLHHHHQQQQPCSSDNTMSCSDTSGDPQQHLQGSQGHSYPHPQEQQPWGLQGGSTAAAAAAGGGPSGSAWGGGPSGSGAQGEEATSPWHGPTGTQRHAPILCVSR